MLLQDLQGYLDKMRNRYKQDLARLTGAYNLVEAVIGRDYHQESARKIGKVVLDKLSSLMGDIIKSNGIVFDEEDTSDWEDGRL